MKSCFFIGHRDTSPDIYPILRAEVERHIVQYGVAEFFVGNYGVFDRMAARAVIEAKDRHSEVTLFMLLPYHPAERPVKCPDGFDNTYYPPGMEKVPHRLAILRANRYMVEHVDYLIAYAWHPASNARELLQYARVLERKGTLSITLLTKS